MGSEYPQVSFETAAACAAFSSASALAWSTFSSALKDESDDLWIRVESPDHLEAIHLVS